jgi:predicted naringenin-chalcone synthase
MASTHSSRTRSDVALLGVATAVPETSYTQQFALDFLLSLPAFDESQKRFLTRIYRNTGIEKRHSVVRDYAAEPGARELYPPGEDFRPEPGLAARNRIFIREAARLSELAASRLLDSLPDIDRSSITHLITVSCTGFSAPGFDLHLVNALGLAPGTHRLHIGFMGCFAGFPALKTANDICRGNPQARVLIVAVELCTLHFQQRPDPDFMVANSLFADGAAAILVGRSTPGPARRLVLEQFASTVIPESVGDMAWEIGPLAFDMKLSRYVPRLVAGNISAILQDLLQQAGYGREDVDIWAIHPGGRAILDRSAESLGIETSALHHSYEVLRDYGNMSSVTIFFVLKLILERESSGLVCAAAFGPGLTVETGLLRIA